MTSLEIAERIEKALEESGKTKMWFYEQSGISRATFSQWKNGKAFPTTETLERVTRTIGVRFIVVEDKKENPAPTDGDGLDAELLKRLMSLTPEEIDKVDAFVQGILASRSK